MSRGCGNPVSYAEIGEGEVVVDLGCGAGIDVILAARQVGAAGRVIGIDFSTEMIERAKQTVIDAGLEEANIRLMVGAVEETGLPDGMADVVISNCVINLCPDKDAVYREIFRILKPGGRIAVSDILLTERLHPDVQNELRAQWSGCLGGAAVKEDYWNSIEAAGFAGLAVVARHVLDPDELFAIATCPSESFSEPPSADILNAAQGKAESVKFRARKPVQS
ncbi:MAG: methyltransferase domain-containing protein [Candidatus Geothermincolia bacterium]